MLYRQFSQLFVFLAGILLVASANAEGTMTKMYTNIKNMSDYTMYVTYNYTLFPVTKPGHTDAFGTKTISIPAHQHKLITTTIADPADIVTELSVANIVADVHGELNNGLPIRKHYHDLDECAHESDSGKAMTIALDIDYDNVTINCRTNR